MRLWIISKIPNTHVKPTSKYDESEAGQYSPEHADHDDSEENNYMPVSKEDVSLGDEGFTVPEEPLEQERFKRSSSPHHGA